ncbi:TolC family protein [Legionella waltersii]|uniref:Outer membrane efflux protein n=1 Tax=Legionella waltersii TaxID=66969 RepID=A0A0W1A5A5_9GAMM|nr:TolC family protein [Legionella waltersii]KTD76507.1 outer membrane efflux protein [Legionella waltersii]SNU93815.1 outer membrane efflux protein [Legionella waltersii]
MQQLVKLCLLTGLLTGCLYEKHFNPPKTPVRNQWTVSDKHIQQIDAQETPYLAWWRDFNDPTLNRLIEQGVQNNTSLNMSRGHIEEAEGELKKIRYQWIPTLDMVTGYSRNPATGFPGVLAVLIPNYTMNFFHQMKEHKRAKYTLAQVKAEDDALKLTIISQLSAAYFVYLAELERKKLLDRLEQDLVLYAKIADKVYKGGLSSEIEQQELFSEASVIQGELEVAERNIVISRNAVRYLLNQNPGEVKTEAHFLRLKNHKIIPGSLPLTVLKNRPDLQMAENELRASFEGIGLAASELLPTIQLDLIGGQAAGDSRYAWPRQKVYFNDQLFKMPLIKMSALGEIGKAKGLNKVSYYHYVDVLQKALRDTTNALADHDRYTNKLARTIKAQQHLAKAYILNYRLYKSGLQSYVSILNSKIALDKINIQLNQDKLQQLLSVVRLYQELAGGYKV